MPVANRLISAVIGRSLDDVAGEIQDYFREAISVITRRISAGIMGKMVGVASEMYNKIRTVTSSHYAIVSRYGVNNGLYCSETTIKNLKRRHLSMAHDAGIIKHKQKRDDP
jgi:hypothetical protein